MVQVVKNTLANSGDVKDTSLIPGYGRSTAEGKATPLSNLAWNHLDEESGDLQSIGSQ